MLMTLASGYTVNLSGATEGQTLKTWSLMETILGTTGAVVE